MDLVSTRVHPPEPNLASGPYDSLLSDCTGLYWTNRIPSCLGIPFRLSEPDSSCLSPDSGARKADSQR